MGDEVRMIPVSLPPKRAHLERHSEILRKFEVKNSGKSETMVKSVAISPPVLWKGKTGAEEDEADAGSSSSEEEKEDGRRLRSHRRIGALGMGNRVSYMRLGSGKVAKKGIKMKENISACGFRPDGKLLAAGDNAGNLIVAQVETQRILQRLSGHTKAVSSAAFAPSKSELVTVSDDTMLKLWDISDGSCVREVPAHGDHIRSLALVPDTFGQGQWATGGSDGVVKLWDLRESKKSAAISLTETKPVESVAIPQFASQVVAVATDSKVEFWDWRIQKRITSLCAHMRMVTGVSFSGDVLITTALDSMIKFHEINLFGQKQKEEPSMSKESSSSSSAFSTIASFLCDAPITSHAIVEPWEDEAGPRKEPMGIFGFVVGMSGGQWVYRRIAPGASELGGSQELQGTARVTARREKYWRPRDEDVVVPNRLPKRAASSMERYLKQFHYKAAMDEALKLKSTPHMLALVDELQQRGTLRGAVDRDSAEQLMPLLQFIEDTLGQSPVHTRLALELLEATVESNAELLLTGTAASAIAQLECISSGLAQEITRHGMLQELAGSVELLLEPN